MANPSLRNVWKSWTKDDLNAWLDNLCDFQKNKIIRHLEEVHARGQDVVHHCALVRRQMEEDGVVVTRQQANQRDASRKFKGFVNSVIRWRLFSGNTSGSLLSHFFGGRSK